MVNLKPIRRGQLISPFGVGAMVDFRGNETLMTAGLDEWPFASDACPDDWLVREERLERRLHVSHFRLPPDYRENDPDRQLRHQQIPFVRFPRWLYCPIRGVMSRSEIFSNRASCRSCPKDLNCPMSNRKTQGRPYMVPVGFVAVCPDGHIEDFPFAELVHEDKEFDKRHLLRLRGRTSVRLGGINIECLTCSKTATMAGTVNASEESNALRKLEYTCSGNMPWLGRAKGTPGDCGKPLRIIPRGASNVYFPSTISSIYIPLVANDVDEGITGILAKSRVWRGLTSGLEDGKIDRFRCEIYADEYGVDADELLEAAQRKYDGVTEIRTSPPSSEVEFRRQEYDAIMRGQQGEATELTVDVIDSADFDGELVNFVEKVGLVRKLRETRVLTGFSRLVPVQDPTSSQLLPMSEGSNLNWLPATVVYGEGIFIQFKEENLLNWIENNADKGRIETLVNTYDQLRGVNTTNDRVDARIRGIMAKFVLLHTFAHSLIDELSFECGYGNASLRERIYCEVNPSEQTMQGILIYTASGDSEGTLGGLVRQGLPGFLDFTIERAIQRIGWCSSDPVCIESTGQGSSNANLAACHGCVLLPETSCETGNRVLDRGLLIGTPNNPDGGFFSGSNGFD